MSYLLAAFEIDSYWHPFASTENIALYASRNNKIRFSCCKNSATEEYLLIQISSKLLAILGLIAFHRLKGYSMFINLDFIEIFIYSRPIKLIVFDYR